MDQISATMDAAASPMRPSIAEEHPAVPGPLDPAGQHSSSGAEPSSTGHQHCPRGAARDSGPVARFRILGPVRIAGPCGCTHRPRSPIRRALLTSLLLQAGQFVTAAQLRGLLWDDPPASASANLRSHLARLRGDLDHAEAGMRQRIERLHEGGSGYRIRVHGGELDLHAFTALAGRGRVALLHGRRDTAIEALEAAVRMWDGPFGEDLPQTRWFAAHCVGINGARLAANQDLFAAYVLAGRHDTAYLIERAIADGPYRDRLWELLVAAHFLAGDPASALAAVTRCRRTFGDQLGLDPPPGVLRLQKAVLGRDAEEVHRLILTSTQEVRGRRAAE